MKGLESKAKQAPQNSDSLSDEEELDLQLAVAMAKKMLVEGKGLDVIKSALDSSQDPSAVIGQFFAQLFAQMHEAFPQDLEISPRIYLARGGVLEQLLDFLEEKLGLPSSFSDEVFGTTVETIKAAAQDPAQGQAPEAQEGAPQAPPPEAAMPQQGVMG